MLQCPIYCSARQNRAMVRRTSAHRMQFVQARADQQDVAKRSCNPFLPSLAYLRLAGYWGQTDECREDTHGTTHVEPERSAG
jgi:hypothetical protein